MPNAHEVVAAYWVAAAMRGSPTSGLTNTSCRPTVLTSSNVTKCVAGHGVPLTIARIVIS